MKKNDTKNTTSLQSVEDRLRAAEQHLRTEIGVGVISIAQLCKAAGVSRSNVYEHHRTLIEKLIPTSLAGGKNLAKPELETKASVNRLRKALESRDAEYKALLRLCIEQMSEIKLLRFKIDQKKSKR